MVFVFPVARTDAAAESDATHARATEAFAAAVRVCLTEYGGYEMKENQGAFMCAFAIDDAARAIAFGAAVHAAVSSGAGDAFACRVGITSGPVSVEPHVRTGRLEAYGPPCNRAARLAKSANPGQTLVDAGTVDRAGSSAVAVPLFDLGEHRFKGVDEPIRVLQVGDGFHLPIGSLDFQKAIVAFNQSPVGNVARTRARLATMDAMGTDSFPKGPDFALERVYVLEALQDGLAARDQAMAAARVGARGA